MTLIELIPFLMSLRSLNLIQLRKKERKYKAVSTDEVIAQLDHLTGGQKQLLKRVLDKHTVLFDGKLGCYTGDKVHLESIDNFTPSWKRAYPVPFTREKKHLRMN